jgi:hypothetical protein
VCAHADWWHRRPSSSLDYQLLRIVQKEVIENPGEQEMLFLCAINKVRSGRMRRILWTDRLEPPHTSQHPQNPPQPPKRTNTHKGKAAKGGYNLGGFVGGGAGGGSGERSRYLCVALEQGSRPAFATAAGHAAAPAAAGQEAGAAATETFVVMYYFSVAPGPTYYQVTIKVSGV